MIDLSDKTMPNTLMSGGRGFLLNTDFRIWLTVAGRINRLMDGDDSGYRGLFKSEAPALTDEVYEQIKAFASPESVVPREQSSERTFDVEIDADYVYAAFMQAYGIDLMEVDMHWHKFRALLMGLPSGTMLAEIISWRMYGGDDKEMKKQKWNWSLPTEYTEEEQAAIDEFNEIFG